MACCPLRKERVSCPALRTAYSSISASVASPSTMITVGATAAGDFRPRAVEVSGCSGTVTALPPAGGEPVERLCAFRSAGDRTGMGRVCSDDRRAPGPGQSRCSNRQCNNLRTFRAMRTPRSKARNSSNFGHLATRSARLLRADCIIIRGVHGLVSVEVL